MKKLNFEDYTEFLVETGAEHIIKSCPNSTTVNAGGKNYFFPTGEAIESKYLKFIGETKREVSDNAERLNLPPQNPVYFSFSKVYGETRFLNCTEIDIKGAYWQTAFNCGLITEGTYLEGLKVPKKIRLMAFGAAASFKDVFYFDGEKYEILDPEFNEYGRRAFFYVAGKVAKLMQQIADELPGGCLFYWVDAVFCKTIYSAWAIKVITEAGYEYTEKPLFAILAKGGNGGKPDEITCYEKISQTETFWEYRKKVFHNPQKNKKRILKRL